MATSLASLPRSVDFLNLPYCTTRFVEESAECTHVYATQAPPDTRDCFTCGQPAAGHGECAQVYLDRPINSKPVLIHLTTKRARCRNATCPTNTFQLHHGDQFRGTMTLRCRQYIEARCFKVTFAALSAETAVPESTIRHIADDLIQYLDANFRIDTPRVLAIDEVYLPSGKDRKLSPVEGFEFPERKTLGCRTVISDSETSQVVDVLEDRKLKTVLDCLLNLQGYKRVRYVTMDMCETFRVAVSVAFGDRVKIIADRWHVVRLLDPVVVRACSDLRGPAKKAARNFRRALLTRSRELELRNPKRFRELQDFLANVPSLRDVYDAKEAFLDLYDSKGRQAAQRHLESWCHSLEPSTAKYFKTFVKTTENWREQILSYWDRGYQTSFSDRRLRAELQERFAQAGAPALLENLSSRSRWNGATNGRAEARNQVIRLINRKGRSYSFRFLRARAIFSTYSFAGQFGVCESCNLPFKRDPRSRNRSREERSHALLRGKRLQDCAPIMPTCRDCDPGSTGITRPGAKPLHVSAPQCGIRHIWTTPEPKISDDSALMHEVQRRYQDAKAMYLRKFKKSRKNLSDMPTFDFHLV